MRDVLMSFFFRPKQGKCQKSVQKFLFVSSKVTYFMCFGVFSDKTVCPFFVC